jgi:hypothetical protein
VSELTGIPMANIVNYMILLLIFVFDPLAIALVLATNRVFELEGKEKPLEPKVELPKEEPQVPSSWLSIIDEGTNEGGEIELGEELLQIQEDIWYPIEEPIIPEEQYDVVNEELEYEEEEVEPEVEETKLVSESQIEVPIYKKEPVVPNGKIEVEDIKEVKENRGYSVPIPQQRGSNTIERIGSNKHIKDGDNNKFFFKRR